MKGILCCGTVWGLPRPGAADYLRGLVLLATWVPVLGLVVLLASLVPVRGRVWWLLGCVVFLATCLCRHVVARAWPAAATWMPVRSLVLFCFTAPA